MHLSFLIRLIKELRYFPCRNNEAQTIAKTLVDVLLVDLVPHYSSRLMKEKI